jgi:hypothetical protein
MFLGELATAGGVEVIKHLFKKAANGELSQSFIRMNREVENFRNSEYVQGMARAGSPTIGLGYLTMKGVAIAGKLTSDGVHALAKTLGYASNPPSDPPASAKSSMRQRETRPGNSQAKRRNRR